MTTTQINTVKRLTSTEGLTADFNFYGSRDAPEISEIASIFGGRSNRLRSVPCAVTDARKLGLKSFTLSENGFQILEHSSSLLPPHASSVPDFNDTAFIQKHYWPELTTALKSHLGLRSAAAINTTTRDVRPDTTAKEINPLNPREDRKSLGGFFVVHGDYSPAGGRAHMRNLVPTFFEDNNCLEPTTTSNERQEFLQLWKEIQDAEQKAILEEQGGVDENQAWNWSGRNYTGPRWAILSVWRPLDAVQSDPLGMMDARSFFSAQQVLTQKPYIGYDRTYKDRPGFTPSYRSENILPVAPLPTTSTADVAESGYRFYYIADQTPEEVIMLKLFDSEAHTTKGKEQGVVECVPHSAFALPHQDGKPARRSAEVRVFAIW